MLSAFLPVPRAILLCNITHTQGVWVSYLYYTSPVKSEPLRDAAPPSCTKQARDGAKNRAVFLQPQCYRQLRLLRTARLILSPKRTAWDFPAFLPKLLELLARFTREKAAMNKQVQETEAEILQASLELECYLERLEHEQRPYRPHQGSLVQPRIYQMAALFRAASPGATEPDPRFVARLEARVAAAAGNCSDKAKERAGYDTHFGRR